MPYVCVRVCVRACVRAERAFPLHWWYTLMSNHCLSVLPSAMPTSPEWIQKYTHLRAPWIPCLCPSPCFGKCLSEPLCRHRFASILFSCWLYFCLLSSCSTCRPWRCWTLAAQQRGAPGCRTTYAGTAIAGIRDFAATLLPARASSTPRRWIVVVVNIYLSTCLSVCLCTLQTLSLDRGRGRQRFGGAAFFALVDVGTLHTDAALSPSRQCFDQR